MNSLQKSGGIAALIHAVAYLVAIALYLSVMSPILEAEPAQYLAMLPDYQGLLYVWILIGYWVSAAALIVAALALYDRLKAKAPAMMQVATAFGLIWAALIIGSGNLMLNDFIKVVDLYANNPQQAETILLTLGLVENGIISGNEVIGGLWSLLLSWAALRTGGLPRLLRYLGLVLGLAGVVSVFPPITETASMIFGLGMIPWFVGLGIALWRSNPARQHKNGLMLYKEQGK
ncbi:MAG: DUF4386 family protein [Chloroflexota bacterium]